MAEGEFPRTGLTLGIAEPACGSHSRLCRLQRRPTRVGLGCHPGVSRLVGSTRGPVRNERAWPAAPSIRRDRTWPGQSRQACATWTERTRGSGARAPARRRPCQAKAASCEGGVARIRGRGARSGLLVEDFLFHAAAAPIPTRPPFLGSWGLRKAMRAAPTLAGRPRARLRTAPCLLEACYYAC